MSRELERARQLNLSRQQNGHDLAPRQKPGPPGLPPLRPSTRQHVDRLMETAQPTPGVVNTLVSLVNPGLGDRIESRRSGKNLDAARTLVAKDNVLTKEHVEGQLAKADGYVRMKGYELQALEYEEKIRAVKARGPQTVEDKRGQLEQLSLELQTRTEGAVIKAGQKRVHDDACEQAQVEAIARELLHNPTPAPAVIERIKSEVKVMFDQAWNC